MCREDDAYVDDNGSNMNGGKDMGTLTPAYCHPESLRNTSSGISQAPKPSHDMWALSVILYIILTGVHPFKGRRI